MASNMIDKLLPVSYLHQFLFNEQGILKLILTDKNNYLTEEEIAEYLLVNPQVYDTIAQYSYGELMESNITIGKYIREVFGLYHPNNPNVVYNDNVSEEYSPENVSFAVLKFIWIYATGQMTKEQE